MRAEVKLTKTVVNDRIPKVLAPTADGQVDIPAIIVGDREVSRYHPMDSTHIRVRCIPVEGAFETVLHIGQLSPTHPLYEAAKAVLS